MCPCRLADQVSQEQSTQYVLCAGTAAGSSSSQGEEVGTGLNAPGAWDVVDDGDDFGGDYLGSDLPPLTTPVASAPAPALGPGVHQACSAIGTHT